MRIPDRIGRYEIVGHLATGGMAEILLGRLTGPSGFERAVVVKRILPHLAREQAFIGMFLDEARIAAGVHHPNVVHVYELLQEDGELALVMEYLEGESVAGLQRRLAAREQRMDFDVAAHVIAEACAGLHAAHELVAPDGTPQKLVHRDISPHNLFIGYDGQVKVLDFGIAKAANRAGRTKTGQLKGKFEYMSPEQCRGEPLDRRSDIFSLGIVLYELTTGSRLFRRDGELAILNAITREDIPLPSRLVPGYPKALEAVCLRALGRRRDDRPATAATLRRDLLAFVRERAGEAEPGERLAELMDALFAERAEEKRDMLRRVGAGSALERVVEGEPDAAVELPIARDDDSGATRATAELDARVIDTGGSGTQHRARGWAVGAGAFVAGALALVALERGYRTWSAPVAAHNEALPSAVASGVPGAIPVAQDPNAADAPDVVVRLSTTPPGATVTVDDAPRGATPLDLRVPRSSQPLRVELAMRGFATVTELVVADRDQTIDRPLVPLSRAAAARGPTAASASTAAPAAAASAAPRAQPSAAASIRLWE